MSPLEALRPQQCSEKKNEQSKAKRAAQNKVEAHSSKPPHARQRRANQREREQDETQRNQIRH
jgi:hypothetical protein